MAYTIAGWILFIGGLYLLAGGDRSFARQWQDLKNRLNRGSTQAAQPAPEAPVVLPPEETASEADQAVEGKVEATTEQGEV